MSFLSSRAKAKSIGSLKSKTHRTASPLPPPPELGQATQVALATLLQEDDREYEFRYVAVDLFFAENALTASIFIIPCTCLTIGKWNRVSCNEWDLLAWFCETKRCLTWFVKSKAYSFKMQVALDWVGDLSFRNADPGRGILVLNLLRPPRFFLRKDLPSSDRDPPPYWRACDDWTEDNEASLGLRHVLEGPALPLAYIVGYIKDRKTNIKQFLPPPVVEYSTSSHSALSSSRDYCSGSLSRCHPMSSGWSATSGQQNRQINEPAPFSSYPNSCISSFSGPMAPPRGMPDSRLCNDRTGFTGFTGVNTMSNPASTSPSPLPISQLSYSGVQIPSGDRYLSPPLPGLSEIFSSTKYHQ